jgi:hypothetical protein
MPRGAAHAVNAASGGVLRSCSALTVTAPLSVTGGGGRDDHPPHPPWDNVTTIAASMNCTKIAECCTLEAQATIFSCGPTAPLVVPRERIVAAQLDI